MAENDDELSLAVAAKDAVANTNAEVFRQVMSEEAETEETVDRSLEEMGDGLEGQVEPDEDEAEAQDAQAPEAEAKPEDGERARDEKGRFVEKDAAQKPDEVLGKDVHQVPVGKFTEERQRRQAAEAERDALRAQQEAERKTAAERYEMAMRHAEAVQRQAQPTSQQQPQAQAVPDMFADPKAYQQYQENILAKTRQDMEAMHKAAMGEVSLQLASVKYGETFSKAFKAVEALDRRNPADQQVLQSIGASPNPGEAVVNWYRQQEAVRRVGNDPEAYEKKVREDAKAQLMKDPEFRKQILEGMRAEASGANGGSPRTVTRGPRSLNAASGSNTAHAADDDLDNSDRGILRHAFRDQA